MTLATPPRPRSTLLSILALWIVFYASFTLFYPPLLDDADSVHAEVAREMLLRHDYITLYTNGIRYLEKAPLLYWSMAASFHLFGVSTAAARIPLAFTVLALALLLDSFARRIYRNARAGLYAALILLSSFGFFIYTRLNLPDAMVCLWLALGLSAFYLTESQATPSRLLCYAFATACALNVLSKGLIGIVFPIAIVLLYLLLTRGPFAALTRIRQLHPWTSIATFLAIAAPWHILIALANPTQGHPGSLTFIHGHWHVPLPTDGNVHGWLWFYFINEQVLRYLNLRVPRDYDTVPLWLFWGLCLIWLMPFSAFVFRAFARFIPLQSAKWRRSLRTHSLDPRLRAWLLLAIWTAVPLVFFSFSTRQEYYVLPALPPLAILIAGWLAQDSRVPWSPITRQAQQIRRSNVRITAVLLTLGVLFALAATVFLFNSRTPPPHTPLAQLLQQNPGDYALSMGHFLDLDTRALSLFRLPLVLAAAALFLGPLASYILRRRARPHAATLALAAGAFIFLLAAHLGFQTFAPTLTSERLAVAIAPQLRANDLIVIHQEYEYGSTLGFYLRRPTYVFLNGRPEPIAPIHILTTPLYRGTRDYGRSSNLWYGSFFRDSPHIFETPQSLAQKWPGPQRIFLWQDLANQPGPLPPLPGPIYVIAESGGKEIISNQPNSIPPSNRRNPPIP